MIDLFEKILPFNETHHSSRYTQRERTVPVFYTVLDLINACTVACVYVSFDQGVTVVHHNKSLLITHSYKSIRSY